MSIKKAKANFHNGVGFDTFHYETQIKQVKVVDANGNVTSDLETELVKVNTDIDTVDAKAINAQKDVDALELGVGILSTLKTTAKTVVPAINEVKAKADLNSSEIGKTNTNVDDLDSRLNNHNHDNVYLKLSGGDLSGQTTISNNLSFAGKNTSGQAVNIGKVDEQNNVVIGNSANPTKLDAKDGNVVVNDGTKSYKVFHAGNMGHGSGFDSDKLDGIEGSNYARRDVNNHLDGDQYVEQGRSVILKAPSGSSQAGAIIFRDGDNRTKAYIQPDVNGNIQFVSGAINAHTIRNNGEMISIGNHILDASKSEVSIRWRSSANDSGIGYYLNNSTDRLGLYDWRSNKFLFVTERSTGMVEFVNAIKIQGKRVYVQTSAPTYAEVGDIWFDI